MRLDPILARWRLFALLASAFMLAAAHAFETFGGYAPCVLCLRQREVYWAIATVAAAAMILVRLPDGQRWRTATCLILGLGFLASAGVAAYHAGAEWKFWPGPAACATGGGGGVTTADLAALMGGASVRAPACDEAPWAFAGLSMAGWNVVISLILAALSVAAGLREARRR